MAGTKGHRGWGRIRRLPSKRYQASYVGPDMARHNAPMTFSTKADAERWLSAERRLIERDDWSPSAERTGTRKTTGLTVGAYASEWIEHRKIKHRTRAHYETTLAKHIVPVLGSVLVRNLTAAMVRKWHAGLDPATPTINSHAYGLLHAVMATAVTDQIIESNPCSIRGAIHANRRREPVLLTVAEVGQLADKITPQRFRVLLLLCAWCGLRWGEVAELRRKDVSADASTLSVSRAVVHRDGCRISTPKSGLARTVMVPPHIRGDVLEHLDAYVGPEPEALLFVAPRGGCHLPATTFRVSLGTALKDIGREGTRIHDLRHFTGSMLARVASLPETMAALGHSTVGASLKYQHQASGRPVEIAAEMSKLAEGHSSDQ